MRTVTITLVLCMLLLATGGCMASSGLLGIGGDSWQEEVLLHDGRKIVADRHVFRGGRHEIGQLPPYKEQSLTFTLPGTRQRVVWEDTFSKELGAANFLPMLLDVYDSAAYLVVKPMGCLSYNKWGRPNPPYVIFRYDGNAWQRILLEELPAEITAPNLILSAPDLAVSKAGTRIMTSEMIQKIISGYKQPEYKTILREPLEQSKLPCTEMIRVDNGWVGIEWFTSQPT
ncbi:MAG: hypothetical protein BWK76_24975, partial [Desulfobulbaceae bacterium A2]